MSILEALILGVIQGLTEFLPVSSSGHLELAKFFLSKDTVPEEGLLFTVMVHGATALSTVVIFREDISRIILGLFKSEGREEFNFSLKIVLSMIPAAAIGLAFNDEIEALFSEDILLVGVMLLVTGLLLYLADRAKKSSKKVGYVDALIIGISQAIAILPGISRSGATISTSVLLGIDKEEAARFSFLMVVPLILGKMAKDILDGTFSLENENFLPIVVGFIAAFITGLFACKLMIKLVKNSQLKVFAIYCLVVGVASISFALLS